MIYYELITKKNKSKVHSSPQGLLIGSLYYPAYIGSHDTKLEIYIFQKITIGNIRRYIHIPALIKSDASINYNAESGKYSNQQHINRKSSYICRSLAQLPWTKLLLRSNNCPKFWAKIDVSKLCQELCLWPIGKLEHRGGFFVKIYGWFFWFYQDLPADAFCKSA